MSGSPQRRRMRMVPRPLLAFQRNTPTMPPGVRRDSQEALEMAKNVRILALVVPGVLLGSLAQAQTTGRLSGTVSDTAGAVLPGVTVTVNEVRTGLTRSAFTDEGGSF